MTEDEDDFSVEELILDGIIEFAAIDEETGEFLYSFTNKVKEALPELYNMHIMHVYEELLYFWELGFVELIDWESSDPTVRLTEKALDEQSLSLLPDEKRRSLEELKRLLRVI